MSTKADVMIKSWLKQDKIRKIDKGYKSLCCVWQGAVNTPGYPQLRWNGEVTEGHRLILGLKLDEQLKSSDICEHLCNVKRCVNPSHLRKGTVSSNTKAAHDAGLIGKPKKTN